jgi:hypothetical protein
MQLATLNWYWLLTGAQDEHDGGIGGEDVGA